MLRGFLDRIAGLAIAILFIGLPLQLLLGRRSVAWLLLTSIVGLWVVRVARRLMISSTTSKLAVGECAKAKRRYYFLRYTSIRQLDRLSCELSIAACDAAAEKLEACLSRLEGCEIPESEQSLVAVALNLKAYCLARMRQRLDEAIALAQRAVELRPQVAGFRHTRGLLLFELGRHDEAIRDLEATWDAGAGTPLFESERCFDLGRLWSQRGQEDYARDYFARALRAFPEGPWAQKASALVGRPTAQMTETLDTLI